MNCLDVQSLTVAIFFVIVHCSSIQEMPTQILVLPFLLCVCVWVRQEGGRVGCSSMHAVLEWHIDLASSMPKHLNKLRSKKQIQ